MAAIFWGDWASPRNGAMATGSWVSPTPVTSTRNCARAGKAGVEINAAIRRRRKGCGNAAESVG